MATVVLAGGGTAGHIEPALAVARHWMITHPKDRCIFLGTKSGLENTLVPSAGFELRIIPKVGISRKPSTTWLRTPFDLIAAVIASLKIVKRADVLIGFGGYVSAPAYLAAFLARTPIVIHEANAKPGWANRLGARFTTALAVAHPVDQGRFSEALLAGLPLRSDVAQACIASAADWSMARSLAKARLGFPTDKPLVFIMGGSQGSVAIEETRRCARYARSKFYVRAVHRHHRLGVPERLRRLRAAHAQGPAWNKNQGDENDNEK